MKTSVIIPFESNNDVHRLRALQYIIDWWKDNFDFEIIIGRSDPYTKGSALHNGVNQTNAECLILSDADSFITPIENITKAVNFISSKPRWSVPYNRVYRFTEEESEKWYSVSKSLVPDLKTKHNLTDHPYYPALGGGIVILHRELWDVVGGIDSRFSGWGGEDRSFGYALSTMHSHAVQMEGRLLHMWHPDQGPSQPMSIKTESLYKRYRDAYRKPTKMKVLVDENILQQPSNLKG